MNTFKNDAVAAAISDMRAAQNRVLAALEADYQIGAAVIVHHHRGQFAATVVGHRRYSFAIGEVIVRNNSTGKTSNRYYEALERTTAGERE